MCAFDEVLPLVLFDSEQFDFVSFEDFFIIEVIDFICGDDSLWLFLDKVLSQGRGTAMRCNLSKIVLRSMEWPQLWPLRMESRRSWQ
mgnify:CR=1 FL=1